MSSTVLEAIRQVCGPSSPGQKLALHEPDFGGTEAWSYIRNCLDTGWVSTAGRWVNRFEQELCSITGAAHAIAVTNGTVALRLALHLVGVRAGDEVIIPPLSFVATANAVAHLGGIPHFVDIEANTLGLDPKAVQERLQAVAEKRAGEIYNRNTGRRIAAILPVHVFGYPAMVPELVAVAETWGVPLIEDAAEALGSWRGNTHCGLFGAIGTLSFNGNKLITTGGGGALLTNNPDLARDARHLSTTAKLPHPWAFEHDAVGWNDRLPNLNAALGVAQLEDLQRRLEAKRLLAKRYEASFAELHDMELLNEPPGCCSNHWLVSLRFTTANIEEAREQRESLLKAAHADGLLLRPIWQLLHHLPMYSEAPRGALPIAEDQEPRLLNLPSSPQLIQGWGRDR